MITLDNNKLLAVCKHHDHAMADSTVADFLSDLKKLLTWWAWTGHHPSVLHYPQCLDFIEVVGFLMVEIVGVFVIVSFSH